jgi:hypothetical protein
VQRIVAARAAPPLRAILQRGLGLAPADLVFDRPPHPAAARWALALWDERIVGDLHEWPDDSPIIFALTRLSLGELVALARTSGLVKLALAAVRPSDLRPRTRGWYDGFRQLWGEAEPSLRSWARREYVDFVQSRVVSRLPGRSLARFGLVSVGRLLALSQPYRIRWALQHLPYTMARSIRPWIKESEATVAARERVILRIAWDRLVAAGRIRALGGPAREQRSR